MKYELFIMERKIGEIRECRKIPCKNGEDLLDNLFEKAKAGYECKIMTQDVDMIFEVVIENAEERKNFFRDVIKGIKFQSSAL